MPTKKAVKKAPTKKAVKKATVKKVVKKTPAKKAVKKAVKKTSKKTSSKKDLIYASDSNSFWVSDGQILNSLIALRDALDDMNKEIYEYHAGGERNDFSLWVETVLCDDKCAKDLHKAKTPLAAKTAVVKHLKLYSI